MPLAICAGNDNDKQDLVDVGQNINDDGGKKSMFKNYQRKIRSKEGRSDELEVTFASIADSSECSNELQASIVITAQDDKGRSVRADVYVDDNRIGKTPNLFQVPLCSFKLMLKTENEYFYQKLDLHKGVPTFINATLRPNLEWSKKAENVKSPADYCKNLKEGGHKDWRLPTIDDVKTMIKCPSKLMGGYCEFKIESYKSLTKSDSGTKLETFETETWHSSAKDRKIDFMEKDLTFFIASPDCPNASIERLIKADSFYFRSVCSLDDFGNGSDKSSYSVRCVR